MYCSEKAINEYNWSGQKILTKKKINGNVGESRFSKIKSYTNVVSRWLAAEENVIKPVLLKTRIRGVDAQPT